MIVIKTKLYGVYKKQSSRVVEFTPDDGPTAWSGPVFSGTLHVRDPLTFAYFDSLKPGTPISFELDLSAASTLPKEPNQEP